MSDSSKAVFLSYASQDAEAARCICETLRAAGVEVWFDADGGLEHGDEWDAKIRRQIKECVLFIPIVSASTQARHEGYFRLEWELAAQRAMSIASGVAFILPVVIDGTREPDALVPDRFRTVQWTKLPGGVVTPEVKARYLKLWSHRTGAFKHESDVARVSPPVSSEDTGQETRATAQVGRPLRGRLHWLIGAALALALLGTLGWKFWHRAGDSASLPEAARRDASPTSGKSATPTAEARELVVKMWTELNKPELARAELEIADDLGKRATTLNPQDADAWAAWSQVDSLMIYHGFATVQERVESARTKVTRALGLAPEAYEPRLAQACFLVRGAGESGVSSHAAQAEALLRALRRERPAEPRALLALGILLRNLERPVETRETLLELAKIPAFAALAWNELGWAAYHFGDWPAAEAAADRSLEIRPNWAALMLKLDAALWTRGDLALAKSTLDQLPLNMLQEDWVVGQNCEFYRASGQPEQVLRVLTNASRDWLRSGPFVGPTDYLAGLAHAMLKQPDAARLSWQSALKQVELRLDSAPKSPLLVFWKGDLRLRLGQRTEGEKHLRLARELAASDPNTASWFASNPYESMLLGDYDQAVRILEANIAKAGQIVRWGRLQLDPVLKPLHGRADFEALRKRVAADPRLSPSAKNTANSAAADPKSVAVLAFVNQSNDPENEYFSDGIADELLTVLQKIPGLRVAARTSAFSFKGKGATAKEVGEKLGMAHVVEGSVQKSGNRVKITARLSRAATNEEVWSKSFGPLELTDVFATQSELAEAIVGELRGRLTGNTSKSDVQLLIAAATKGGTRNSEAHQLFLQGTYFANLMSLENLTKASAFFRRATDSDSNFALAWAAFARAQAILGRYTSSERDLGEHFAFAREACKRALTLEPDLVETQLALFEIQTGHDYDWRSARETVQRARALAPSDARVIHNAALLARIFGDLSAAVELAREALILDPVNAEIQRYLGSHLGAAGRYAEAVVAYRRAIELSPGVAYGRGSLALNLARMGRFPEALAEAEKETATWGRLTALGFVYWEMKDKAKADKMLLNLIATSGDTAAMQVAQLYAQRGENDLAFQWLDRAYRQRDSGIAWSKADRHFLHMRTDLRWPAFLKQIGLHDDQLK